MTSVQTPFVYVSGGVTKVFARQIVTTVHEGATTGIIANHDFYPLKKND